MKRIRLSELQDKVYLTENEGMAYTGFSRKFFRRWAKEIGAKCKLIDTPRGRVLYVRAIIDQKILEGRK